MDSCPGGLRRLRSSGSNEVGYEGMRDAGFEPAKRMRFEWVCKSRSGRWRLLRNVRAK